MHEREDKREPGSQRHTSAGPADRPAQHPMLMLQRDAGNAAVATAVDNLVWKAPPELIIPGRDPVCRTGEDVQAALSFLSYQMLEQAGALEDEPAGKVRAMAETVRAEGEKYGAKPALAAEDPKRLTEFVGIATLLAKSEIGNAIAKAEQYTEIPTVDTGMLDSTVEAAIEKAHQSFVGQNVDRLGEALAMMKKAEDLSAQVKNYTGKVQEYAKYLQSLKSVAQISEVAKKIQELNAKFAEQLGEAKKQVELMREIATAWGKDNISNGTTLMQGVDQLDAAIKLVDRVVGSSLGKAVPVFGDLWNKWYKPMVDECIKGLRVFAGADHQKGVDLALIDMMKGASRDANGAPLIENKFIAENNYFPGGQPVLSYVWAIRNGKPAVLTDEVRDFFMDRAKFFNVDEEKESDQMTGGDWSITDPTSYFRSSRKHNIGSWVAKNIDKVWAMLYGKAGEYIN